MARFYKTTTPDFVEDFMYTPPWELAGKIMEANEQGIQTALASTAMFQDFDIQHIDDPVLKEQASSIKDKYASSADDITRNIQAELSSNPQAWRSHLPKIGNLAQELQKDFKSGDIFKMMSDSQRQASWVENNKKAFEQNPELANAAYNAIMTDFRSDPERKKEWSAGMFDKISDFDINSKEIIEQLRKFETQTEDSFSEDGSLIIKRKFKDKDALVRNYMSLVLADPEAQRYIQQATALGMPGFADKNGKPIPWEVPINNRTGERISEEKFRREVELTLGSELTEEEKVKQGRDKLRYSRIPNSEFAWTRNFIGMADVIGGEISREIKVNPLYTQEINRRHQINLAHIRNAARANGNPTPITEIIEQLQEDQEQAALVGDIDSALIQGQSFAPASISQPKGVSSTQAPARDSEVEVPEVEEEAFEQERGGPNVSTTPRRTNYVTRISEEEKRQQTEKDKKTEIKPIRSEKEYIEMMNKFIRLQDANIKRLEANADNLQYPAVQKILQNKGEGMGSYNYQRTRTLDNAINKITYKKLGLDQGERMSEEDQFAVEIHSLFNDNMDSLSGSMLENQIIEYLKHNYDKPEEYFQRIIKYKAPTPAGGWEEVERPILTTNFKRIIDRIESIEDMKKKSYADFSREAQDDAIVKINPKRSEEIRRRLQDSPNTYRLIPVNKAEYDGVNYKDPTNKNKILEIPTIDQMLKKNGKDYDYSIDYVSPHTPYGMAAIVQKGDRKFFLVNTKGVIDAMTDYNSLFREDKNKPGSVYENLAERDYMHAHLNDNVYNLIINHTAMFEQLYKSGTYEEDPRYLAYERDEFGVKIEDGKPVLVKDKNGKPGVFSKYNDVNIPIGTGDVYTIRHYYDSGRDTPYKLFENGIEIPDAFFKDIISLSWAINARANARLAEKRARRDEELEGVEREIYEF